MKVPKKIKDFILSKNISNSKGGTDMTVNYIESLSINIDGLLILIVLMILVFKFIRKN